MRLEYFLTPDNFEGTWVWGTKIGISLKILLKGRWFSKFLRLRVVLEIWFFFTPRKIQIIQSCRPTVWNWAPNCPYIWWKWKYLWAKKNETNLSTAKSDIKCQYFAKITQRLLPDFGGPSIKFLKIRPLTNRSWCGCTNFLQKILTIQNLLSFFQRDSATDRPEARKSKFQPEAHQYQPSVSSTRNLPSLYQNTQKIVIGNCRNAWGAMFGKNTSLILNGNYITWEGCSEVGRVSLDSSTYAIFNYQT